MWNTNDCLVAVKNINVNLSQNEFERLEDSWQIGLVPLMKILTYSFNSINAIGNSMGTI